MAHLVRMAQTCGYQCYRFCSLGRAAAASTSSGTSFLDRRAWDVAVRAEYATIAFERTQNGAAMLTIVEILARIGRHRIGRYAAAFRAGKGRSQLGHRLSSHAWSGASKNAFHATDNRRNAVAALRRKNVARDGASTVQGASFVLQARRLRKRSAQPIATAAPDAIVSGQWYGTTNANPPALIPAKARPAGMTQQAAAEKKAAKPAATLTTATGRSAPSRESGGLELCSVMRSQLPPAPWPVKRLQTPRN